MPKYQFFKSEHDHQHQWLDMADGAFLLRKEQLLSRGFEVIGDTIYADSEQEAIAKFNSGMMYPLKEYNVSTPSGGLFYAVKSLLEILYQRLSRPNKQR
ncbi:MULTISPECIES: hypothetical protein [Deefgea]|uniref:hypothetical protein n=1 Tax=Deefgea TaxID=400947 RepID=UPI0019407E0A|nr:MULTISPECIES: hypothetical protein [Deefgea]MBM9888159.1 hypothetical protein [Deefgea sp. CFH1-16]